MCEFNWWEYSKEMTIINSEALCYTFETSDKKYQLAQKFKVLLDEKTSWETYWKDKINNFLLFNFVFFSYRQSYF